MTPDITYSRNLGTILAALRAWQEKLNADSVPAELMDIATDGGSFPPLAVEEIDELCEELNVALEDDDQDFDSDSFTPV